MGVRPGLGKRGEEGRPMQSVSRQGLIVLGGGGSTGRVHVWGEVGGWALGGGRAGRGRVGAGVGSLAAPGAMTGGSRAAVQSQGG